MDNKKEIKQFNKKLLITFISLLAIFTALLVTRAQAINVSSEIESLKQTDRGNPTYLTYNDLVDYYDILCCQHGTPLPGQGQVMLNGSHSGGSFSYDMGYWENTGYSKGSQIESHKIYYQGNDFSASSYTHRTYGYYTIIEQHIATPKEAYIIAEMKKELEIENGRETALEYVIENGQKVVYTGGLINSISQTTSTGEVVYTVNQRYVLDTGHGAYYVRAARDSDGNVYYVYETNSNGSLVEYKKSSFKYIDPKTGTEVECTGIHQENVYYEFNGTISSGNTVASSSGTLYLVEFDTVVDVNGTLYYCYLSNDYNYIQIAWWTTEMGTNHGTVLPSAPNSLSKEAEAFEDYILTITGKNSVSELDYAVQSYDFEEDDGTHSTGSVTAPVIEYKPEFNDDADQNGVKNEADELTPSFDYNKQTYIIGPLSVNYVKETAHIPGRNIVDFSVITGTKLVTNLGELEFGKDWNFKFLADQARDERYPYPNPNEVFYLEINYKEDLTEIQKFEFDFKYMNAGAELDIYDGNYNQVVWTVKHSDNTEDCNDPDCESCPHFKSRDIWLECTSVSPNDSQTLAHALIGARWYNYTSCEIDLKVPSARILIEKRTYDADGNDIIPINKTFHFRIYINNKPFQDITVDVKNGYGKAISNKILLKDGESASYKVVELGNYDNNGPWEGFVSENQIATIEKIEAENYMDPYEGWLEIDKKLLNSTPALENETFSFTVSVTGKFSYNGGPIKKYTSKEPLIIPVTITGAGSWKSGTFEWYGSAPKYKVVENIPDNATYELVNGVISNGNGYLKNNVTQIATATNQPTTDWTILEVDKRLVSETQPQPGEIFKFNLTITGEFSYNGDQIQQRTLVLNDQVLNSANSWKWQSGKIVWNNGKVPTYTLSEVYMSDGTTFVSISDENQTSLVNNFTGKLNPEKTLVIITNERENEMIGRLQINKLVETEDLYGKTFNFIAKVTGTFKYQGVQYTNQTVEIPVTVTVPAKDDTSNTVPVGEWKSEIFSWKKGTSAPTYEVTEVNLPEGSKFVSISNGTTTITSSQTITGTLNGVEGKNTVSDDKAGKVVVTCINTGTAKKQAHIVIIKESTDESIDDYVFFFKVTISGTFKYYNKVNSDGTLGYTQYTNETLVLDGKIDDVEAVCGGEDWISELIVWDEMDPNPTYTVEEISIPANIDFVSISNRIKTSTSKKIDGALAEGTENNYITAINKPGNDFVDGSLRIVKKTSEDLKGRKFYFDLKVTGEFDYAGKHYGADTENGNTYTLQNIEVEANGNPWVSGIFSWDKAGTAPTYEVKEVNLPEGSHFVSISNEKEICTDSSMTITGNLSLTKPVKITAINYGDNIPNGSHIEITKEVLNEKLKGTNFYFNVKVTSTSPFRYHDLEDVTKVTQYNAGDVVEFKNVVAVADEKDWISGYFEWDEGANIPTYEISELTGAFPDGVKSISIRNDKNIIVKELTNTSTENLVITGSLTGDVTHIIAVNDADEDVPLQGKIRIEKQGLSDIIDGEEFTFTLKITGKFKYEGQDYRELTLKDIKITANGPVWESGVIEWYEKDGNPTYTVTEETATFADGTEFVSIRNAYQTNTAPVITGTVEPHFNNWVIAENTFAGYNKGRLQIHKVLLDEKGNQIDGVEFKFKVTVTFEDGSTQEDIVTVTSGGYWRSDWYSWSKKQKNPTYHIEEIDNNGYECTIDKPDGELIAQNTEDGISGIVSVNATNVYKEEHQAQIRVNKELIVNDKLSEDDVTVSFEVLVNISGSFTYKGKAYNDSSLTLKVTLSKDSNWTWLSDVIRWNGDEAPTFTVEEPEEKIPVGWYLVETNVSPEDHKLVDGETAVADITNEWKYNEELILTMKLGGKVWDDTNRTTDKYVDSIENGIIDEGEPGISNVKVTIYRALVNKSTGQVEGRLDGVFVYDDNNVAVRADNVTYTDEKGNWSFEAVSVPAFTESEKEQYGDNYIVTYDAEFEYDGQTYEPTEFLATAGGATNSYVGADSSNNMYSDIQNRWTTIINSSTSERDKYLYDSMAIDNLNDRTNFNNSFAEIQGLEPIDDEGNTVGTTGSGKELNYTSVDSVSFFNSDNSRKISTLETLNEDDEIQEDLRMNAATSNSNLTFPFYTTDPNYDTTAWHLKGWDKTITDVLKITYKFEAVYNYCLSINLGLVEREATDIAIEKDLTEALVVVNGKALKYKFNTAIDLEDPDYTELLYKQLAVADAQIEYKLGLYKGDYYYRAAVYDGTDAGNALQGFYTAKLGLPVDSSEMEIYLKYTINVYNQSETYDVKIGEIADYYDSSFKLVENTESRYVQTVNGKEVDKVIEVANPSSVKYLTSGNTEKGNGTVGWNLVKSYDGSDGIKYNKITTSSLAGTKLSTGDKASMTVTFKIDKDAVGESGVLNAIKLGQKHNVAEITKFTSYYSDKSENRWSTPGQISGRVDEDSAPDNVNIEYYNEKAYYEDDTDSAPIITIGIKDEQRAVSGMVWDDAQTQDAGYGQTVGNGLYNPDEGDKLVNNLTTEIYESISIPETTDNGETVYREYQFAWPTETPVAALGNHTIAELTGFHQATVTENGGYSFVNVPAGNYKVRYVYGDKQIETGKSGSEEVYSGQDYKTTAYQIGFNNDKNNDGYVDNEWHDISNTQLSDLRVNDARDDEARRLKISAKSEMLTYDNTSLLATADDKNADHTALFGNYQDVRNNPVTGDGYYMYAETAKINLGVENIYKIGYTTETINDVEIGLINGKSTENGRDVGTSDFTYNIKNVDCGIEERSQTKITLDKQIKQITLMTSDNKVILDAIYDINYTLKSDGSIAATVTLNEEASIGTEHIASLNRRGAYDQGYRYIIAEGTILQGTQIQVKYQLTAFNMSETDRISKDLETLWSVINTAETEELKASTLDEALNKVSTNLYTETKGRVYNNGSEFTGIGYGTYFGSVYYLGSQGVGVRPDETIVKTEIHQMIDYVDPDVEFTDMNNSSRDQSWTNTDINYLLSNHLIDPHTVQILDSEGKVTGETAADRSLNSGERYSIISDKLQEYMSENKNNLILTIDSGVSQDTGSNPGFVKFLEPYMANNKFDRATATITLTVGRFYSSELDASDIDNLAEIIKVENTAGRRDARNIAGNANPYELEDGEPVGIYAVAQGKEKDASATEVITLSPPTGLNADESRTLQLLIVILISVILVAVAIVIIKKKVLIKK